MFEDLARMHKALGDDTRLRILQLLLVVGELCVCDLETALGITQSKASRHLQTLKQARLVADRRDATWVYYRIPEAPSDAARRALHALLEAARGDDVSEADAERARALRRSPRCGAPVNPRALARRARPRAPGGAPA